MSVAHPGSRTARRPLESSLVAVAVVVVAAVALAPRAVLAQDSLSPEASADLTLTPIVSGLGQVTDIRFLPDGRLLITQKTGELFVADIQSGNTQTAATLDVDSSSEKGLLGVEVDPAFATNHFVYLYYSCNSALGSEPCDDLNKHRVSRFVLDPANSTLDLSSEKILVHGLRGPANHDGGGLAIGPDGKLYIGVGDTGCNSGVPPGGTITNWFGTCLTNGNGKILRVNLDGTIPNDNPLVSETMVTACGASCGDQPSPTVTGAPRTEIWAWGFRNPWRFSFDPKTGNLWEGDVGEVTFEELNIVQKGHHYGWPLREGAAGQPVTACATMTPQSGNCVDPIYFCRHGGNSGGIDGNCLSINGGVFVDTCSWPQPWRGRYYFGDNANRRLFFLNVNANRDGVATLDGGTTSPRGNLGTFSGKLPVAFRVGPEGDLYVAGFGEQGSNGIVYRISPIARDTCPADAGTPDAGADGGIGAGDGGEDGGGPIGSVGPTGPRGDPPPQDVPSCGCGALPGAGFALFLAIAIPMIAARRKRAR